MSYTAYLAATSSVLGEMIKDICYEININCVLMKDQKNILAEVLETKPQLVFIQAIILEEAKHNLVTKIKEHQGLNDVHIIVYGVRLEGADFANQIGADAFLPIPFQKEQLESIVRLAVNLPKKLLLISPAQEKIASLHKKLRVAGYDVTVAKTAKEGISYTKNLFPDLIVTDLNLDTISGYEFCKGIKSSKLHFNIPIVILSDVNDASIAEKCFESGAHAILFQPFNSVPNIEKLKAITDPPAKRRTLALVVDDSIVIRNLLSKMLKQLGFTVLTAVNGEDGLKLARSEKPDIITSDYDMPILNGWEMCAAIKHDISTQDIPIIMVTSRDTDIDKKKGDALGLQGYLTKPFSVEELQSTVTQVLQKAETEREQKALAKYVSSDTIRSVKEFMHEGKNITSQEKFITILFTDIVSFSAKCERLEPKAIVELLNRYYDRMIKILLNNDAIIDKLIGDAIVARFDSGDLPGDAFSATKAALEMIDELESFNQEISSVYNETIQVRVGINSGDIILGNLGSAFHRLDYTMIGDNVNITERLQSNSPPQGCLLSGSTHDLIKDLVIVGDKQLLQVKGKSKPVEAYPLQGLKKTSYYLTTSIEKAM